MNDHDEWRIDEAFANMTDPEAREALRIALQRAAKRGTGIRLDADEVALLAATPAPDTGAEERLRAAAERVVTEAETDDDWEGQYVSYLVPAEAFDALRSALSGGSIDEEAR